MAVGFIIERKTNEHCGFVDFAGRNLLEEKDPVVFQQVVMEQRLTISGSAVSAPWFLQIHSDERSAKVHGGESHFTADDKDARILADLRGGSRVTILNEAWLFSVGIVGGSEEEVRRVLAQSVSSRGTSGS
jgi:hypothetical protein